jgi:hypothetical protein
MSRRSQIPGGFSRLPPERGKAEEVTVLEGYRKPFSVSLLTGVSVPQ